MARRAGSRQGRKQPELEVDWTPSFVFLDPNSQLWGPKLFRTGAILCFTSLTHLVYLSERGEGDPLGCVNNAWAPIYGFGFSQMKVKLGHLTPAWSGFFLEAWSN